MPTSHNARHGLKIIAAIVTGACLGVGLFTFYYAEGASYFSKDPEACVNCHIMKPQYDSWQKSSHKTMATCVDCHLPHDFVGKYIAKAENGWNHSKAFTMQDFHEPIMINTKNSQILQNNCIACHRDLTHAQTSINPFPKIDHHTDQFSCVHCHADVGHGERTGLGVLEEYPGRRGFNQLKKTLNNH